MRAKKRRNYGETHKETFPILIDLHRVLGLGMSVKVELKTTTKVPSKLEPFLPKMLDDLVKSMKDSNSTIRLETLNIFLNISMQSTFSRDGGYKCVRSFRALLSKSCGNYPFSRPLVFHRIYMNLQRMSLLQIVLRLASQISDMIW